MASEKFPIDLAALKPLKLDPSATELTAEQKAALTHNIQLCRDAIVFFTALAGARGLSGHTGGAYDTVPEVMIIRAFIAGGAPIVPIFFDEAGHRVATQYLLSVLEGAMPAERLLHYREFDSGLPGHPEKMLTPGVHFSSGRLGHMWAFCNGVALANPGKAIVLLGSDGSQMEGDDAEAGRLAVGEAAQPQAAGRRQQRHHRRPPAGLHAGLRPDPHAHRLRAQPRDGDGRGLRRALRRARPRLREPAAARAGHQAPHGAGHRRRRGQPARARGPEGRTSRSSTSRTAATPRRSSC